MSANSSFLKEVELKYHIYNSLFLRLPFDIIHQTGTHLPIFNKLCQDFYAKGKSPEQIVQKFFKEHFPNTSSQEQITVLFNTIKYVERQVVLFDAVEDAAFEKVNDLSGTGTLSDLYGRIEKSSKLPDLATKLEDFNLRVVLTAHPTQFYSGAVLGIINSLNQAIEQNDLTLINELLLQLGKTPFSKSEKPTPYDEAVSLIWYLENVFYDSISKITQSLTDKLEAHDLELGNYNLITVGFWPGGDRDGNPNVNSEITRRVAATLKRSVFKKYHQDLRALRKKLTFRYTEDLLVAIERKLYQGMYDPTKSYKSAQELLDELLQVRKELTSKHESLFIDDLDSFITKVKLFGLYFAALDLRQDSSVHEEFFKQLFKGKKFDVLSEEKQIDLLLKSKFKLAAKDFQSDLHRDLVGSFYDLKEIQKSNGPSACHRYIISNCKSIVHVLQVLMLSKWTVGKSVKLDIVPLFESIDDLKNAHLTMEKLYKNQTYRKHLNQQGGQTVMLGFSDGTKDGGYLSANWSIYQAKQRISEVSRKYGIRLSFFDGRGGPPARGGGNTHKFYSALGKDIEHQEIQLTLQGQTISSNFGTVTSAGYNLEQLLSAGLENDLFNDQTSELDPNQKELINELSEISLKFYQSLKSDPVFVRYMREVGPLDYYGMTNIASRPTKRKSSGQNMLKSLRAIPFVGTWSQLKQNVPGYYGLGCAFEQFDKMGRLSEVSALYHNSLFFKALIDNSMQSLSKTDFSLTKSFKSHPEFGAFWKKIHTEYLKTLKYISQISGQKHLMEDNVSIKSSISIREDIMLPLTTIQQYALAQIRTEQLTKAQKNIYQKMVVRSMFGIINASRNSA